MKRLKERCLEQREQLETRPSCLPTRLRVQKEDHDVLGGNCSTRKREPHFSGLQWKPPSGSQLNDTDYIVGFTTGWQEKVEVASRLGEGVMFNGGSPSLPLSGGAKPRKSDLVMGSTLIALKHTMKWHSMWLTWAGEEGLGNGVIFRLRLQYKEKQRGQLPLVLDFQVNKFKKEGFVSTCCLPAMCDSKTKE